MLYVLRGKKLFFRKKENHKTSKQTSTRKAKDMHPNSKNDSAIPYLFLKIMQIMETSKILKAMIVDEHDLFHESNTFESSLQDIKY